MFGNRPLGLLSLGCACVAVAVAFSLTREAEAPRGLAEDQLIEENGARLAQADIADTPTGTPIWLDAVLAPGASAIPSDTRSDILVPVDACTPEPRVADGSAIAVVVAGHDGPSGLYGMTPDDLADRAEDYLRQLARRSEGAPRATQEMAFGEIDVVVTTQGPTHLVLYSQAPRTLWTLHTAPEATVTGVTLLGGVDQGLLGGPDLAPVMISDSALRACRFRDMPAVFDESEGGRVSTLVWLDESFGEAPLPAPVGFDSGGAVVVGPTDVSKPVERISGATLYAHTDTRLYGRGLAPWPKAMAQDVEDHALDLAGGDLAAVIGSRQRTSVFDGWSN